MSKSAAHRTKSRSHSLQFKSSTVDLEQQQDNDEDDDLPSVAVSQSDSDIMDSTGRASDGANESGNESLVAGAPLTMVGGGFVRK